ncbi:MAG: IS1595 family transposase [Mycoplasmataceae bacterium]|jgi:transposase-like protein|nr:IS1595 family transposase [Mycoplasmataceae bacterium]
MEQINNIAIENIYNQTLNLTSVELKVLLSKLTLNQRKTLVDNIFSKLKHNCNGEIKCCPHCESIHIISKGKQRGRKRYMCKECNKWFSETTKSMFYHFNEKYQEQWFKYIECMVNCLSLKRSAEICNICYRCSFVWRHKILNLINKSFKGDEITGLIELDDTYFRKSFKGNHKGKLILDRKPRLHGYCFNAEDHAGVSKDKVCVTTALARGGNIHCDVLGYGSPNSNKLIESYKNRVINPTKSKIICDNFSGYRILCSFLGTSIYQLKRKTPTTRLEQKKPTIKGNYHIQNINNFHGQLKHLINDRYKGVSTKHLLNYVQWAKWIRLNKESFNETVTKLVTLCFNTQLLLINERISKKVIQYV